jgi:hypothetical protein
MDSFLVEVRVASRDCLPSARSALIGDCETEATRDPCFCRSPFVFELPCGPAANWATIRKTGHQNSHSIAQYDGVKAVSSPPRLDTDGFCRAIAWPFQFLGRIRFLWTRSGCRQDFPRTQLIRSKSLERSRLSRRQLASGCTRDEEAINARQRRGEAKPGQGIFEMAIRDCRKQLVRVAGLGPFAGLR